MDGQISHTLIAAFVLILFPLTEAFLPLSDAVSELPGYEDSINRLKGLSLEKSSEEEYDDMSVWKNSHLNFDKVSYQTKEGQLILKNINLLN